MTTNIDEILADIDRSSLGRLKKPNTPFRDEVMANEIKRLRGRIHELECTIEGAADNGHRKGYDKAMHDAAIAGFEHADSIGDREDPAYQALVKLSQYFRARSLEHQTPPAAIGGD